MKMRKLLLLLMLAPCIAQAQLAVPLERFDDSSRVETPLSSGGKRYVYAEVVSAQKFLSRKVYIAIDYGQEIGIFEPTGLMGKDGKPMVFNSVVDAMNFMGEKGWEYLDSYALDYGWTIVCHCLFRKEVSNIADYEIGEGFRSLEISGGFRGSDGQKIDEDAKWRRRWDSFDHCCEVWNPENRKWEKETEE